jgi:hypothetical protein
MIIAAHTHHGFMDPSEFFVLATLLFLILNKVSQVTQYSPENSIVGTLNLHRDILFT